MLSKTLVLFQAVQCQLIDVYTSDENEQTFLFLLLIPRHILSREVDFSMLIYAFHQNGGMGLVFMSACMLYQYLGISSSGKIKRFCFVLIIFQFNSFAVKIR